jgi:hypothetical protein
LVDGRQLAPQPAIEILDDLGIALHDGSLVLNHSKLER